MDCKMGRAIWQEYVAFSSKRVTSTQALETNCKPVKCNDSPADIRFPFRERTQQPEVCGHHGGFELFCSDNSTMIHFPSCGNLVVKSISYSARKLDLLHPGNCVHQVFLNLNLTITPFKYYYVLKNYTYLNCSSAVFAGSAEEVRCLSGDGYHVYTVEPSVDIPDSCSKIATIPIPFAYSPFLADNSFGLGLTWDPPYPHGGEEESEGHGHTAGSMRITEVGIVMIVVMAAAILVSCIVHVRCDANKLTRQGKAEDQLDKLLITSTPASEI